MAAPLRVLEGPRGRYDAGVTPLRSSRPEPTANDRRDPSGSGARGAQHPRAGLGGRGRGGPGVPQTGGGALPGWVTEELARVTPRPRVPAAAEELEEAAVAFVDGRFAKARHHAEEAKGLAPRLPAIREILGLAAYRMGRWEEALTELRTYRRLSGDTTHLPVEMDVLRALDRPEEVEAAHALLRRLGGSPAALAEGRVVYGSFLLDQNRAREAWELTRPGSLKADPERRRAAACGTWRPGRRRGWGIAPGAGGCIRRSSKPIPGSRASTSSRPPWATEGARQAGGRRRSSQRRMPSS